MGALSLHGPHFQQTIQGHGLRLNSGPVPQPVHPGIYNPVAGLHTFVHQIVIARSPGNIHRHAADFITVAQQKNKYFILQLKSGFLGNDNSGGNNRWNADLSGISGSEHAILIGETRPERNGSRAIRKLTGNDFHFPFFRINRIVGKD